MNRPHYLARAGLLVATLAIAGPTATAQPPARAEAFDAVLKCRALSDGAARLACYDAAAGRMGEAEKNGEIVVIDRAEASAAHREAFGLHVPSLDFVTRALKPDEVDTLEGVVKSARVDQNRMWTFYLEDGAKWRQISGQLMRDPKPGSKIRIRRGTIGSFLMNVDNQGSIKVHRDE